MELPYERRSVRGCLPVAMKAKKAIAQINIGAELNDNEQTEVFKQNKTPLITNNVMHNCYGFPDIHFEQKKYCKPLY